MEDLRNEEFKYTDEEYTKVCLAADSAAHEAAGLAELNTRQAREIEQLRGSVKAGAGLYAKLKDDRDRWKALRYDALEEIQHWKREAATRMCREASERMVGLGGDVDAMTILDLARKAADRAGKI